MSVDVMVGLQRGDEGKGRFVDMLAGEYDIVARFNGGNNAGHTVVLPDERVLKLHMVPSGIAHPNAMNLIGNGTLINPVKLAKELGVIGSMGIEVSEENLMISSAAHLIMPHQTLEDAIREAGAGGQGSTKSGIAQSAGLKGLRTGPRTEMILADPEALLRMAYDGLCVQKKIVENMDADQRKDLLEGLKLEKIDPSVMSREFIESAKHLGGYITDTVLYINQELRKDKPARVLAEGAQAYWLDIDHGMYPYTTSSSTTVGGVCTGLGIAPSFIDKTTGVSKAIQSHVGLGPFVTEVTDPDLLEKLHGDMSAVDAEKGTTTERIRRLGYLDLPQIRRAQMVNDVDDMILSKLDWVTRFGDEIPVCVAYESDGKRLEIAPDSAARLEEVTPIYESVPSWNEDIQSVRSFADLPETAQRYIEFIEEQTEAPISMIGVGPNPDQVIRR